MQQLPTGRVTFLFTDVEGSTRLLELLIDAYGPVLARQTEIIAEAARAGGGMVFGTEGDAVFAVFPDASDAVRAAVAAQRAVAVEPWPPGVRVRVRMGLHTGEGTLGGRDYVGIDVHRVARIAASGHGGQVVGSGSTRQAVGAALDGSVEWLDLGEHRLKGLERLERLYQVAAEGLDRSFPSLRTVSTRPNNLPAELTSFVGRADELRAVKALVRESRVVTLTGPAGTGKTRLAVQAARELLDLFEDGAVFVDLSTVDDQRLVVPTVARALGVLEASESGLEAKLAEAIAPRELLLVLDNFEHVVESAGFIVRLLTPARLMRVLVTSRAPLRITGEHEYAVDPLEAPDPRRTASAERLAANTAVQLFVDRARSVRPTFELTEGNAAAVASIVARLDGLPLALELGAAWLRVLAPAAIVERLEGRLPLLGGGRRDGPARQQTLESAVAWSHDLLLPPEQALLVRLGVFAGGADLDAIESVCAPGADLGLDGLAGVGALVEANLLRQADTDHGAPRFRTLETVRDFALARLYAQPDVRDAVARRHVAYYRDVAVAAAAQLGSGDLRAALDVLGHEHDNLRAALRWCADHDDAENGLRICSAVWRYWQVRGHLAEGRRIVSQLLELPSAAGRTELRADGLTTAGSLAYWQVDVPETQRLYSEALDIERELGDRGRVAAGLRNLAFAAMLAPDVAQARRLYVESLPILRELGDVRGTAASLVALGFVEASESADSARQMVLEADELYRGLGDQYWMGQVRIGLGVIERMAGDMPAARRALGEAIEAIRELDDVSATAQIYDQLASIDVVTGHADRALRLAAAAERLRAEEGAGTPPKAFARPLDVRAKSVPLLGGAAVDAAWQEGRAMSGAQCAELALECAGDA